MQTSQRRRPRYLSFLLTGGLVGLVATVVLVLGPGSGVDNRGRLFLFLGIMMMGLGALLGGALAVVIERPRRGDTGQEPRDP